MKSRMHLIWGLYTIFLYFYLGLFRNALIDDAFITLRYVKTLLSSGTWGFFPGTIANSATSPLNVILLSAISLFTGPTPEAVIWLALFCFVAMTISLTRVSFALTETENFGWMAGFALLFNPLLVSTLGLESILFGALFAISLYLYQVQKWNLLALSLGLLTLARADGLLFSLVFLLFLPRGKSMGRFILLYLLCILPWYVFSWVHLGSFIPDTFFIKTDQRSWFEWDYFNGMMTLYYHSYPLETILSFLFLPVIPLLFYRRHKQVTILSIIGLAGLVHFIGYSLLSVPPFHWYYAPQAIAIILLGSLGIGVLYRETSQVWRQRVVLPGLVLCFLVPFLGMLHLLARDHFSVGEMPIHSNWATHEQYMAIGLWLQKEHKGETIQLVAGEIGTLAYYCDCHLLDRFSDRSWLQEYIAGLESKPGFKSFLYKINFAFYSPSPYPPVDYVLRAYSNEPANDIEYLYKLETSTKWIRQGYLTLGTR